MKPFDQKTKLAEAVFYDFNLLRVISRFGIFPGFGDKTIGEICEDHEIDPVFFLIIVNSFTNKRYFPSHELADFSLIQMVGYLQKTHSYYIDYQLPLIDDLIDRLCNNQIQANKKLIVVKQFFSAYSKELTDHINREEKVTFPYVLKIEEIFENNEISGYKASDYSILTYEKEHDNVEEKLIDLKNIMIKYLPEPFDHEMLIRILTELSWLEKDLNEHSRIEDAIMIPRVKIMEAGIRKRL